MLEDRQRRLIFSALLLVLGGALFLKVWIPGLNLVLLGVFGGLLYGLSFLGRDSCPGPLIVNLLIWFLALLLGFFIAVYRPADYHYLRVWHVASLYGGGAPFSLYINTSKALGGYLVIVWLLNTAARSEGNFVGKVIDEKLGLTATALIVVTGILVTLAYAHGVFGLNWVLKIPDKLWIFILVNLCITVVAEEAFFRLLIQKKMAAMILAAKTPPSVLFHRVFLGKPTAQWLSAALATLIFTLTHTASFGATMLLFFVAGGIYSLVYLYTWRFGAAVAAHFGVNLCHIVLLEYPLTG